MKVLFFSGPIPEDSEFMSPAFARSGNLAVGGIAEGLYAHLKSDLTCWTCPPLPAWPRFRKLWSGLRRIVWPSGLAVNTVPAPNVLFLREIFRGIAAFFITLVWTVANRRSPRCIVTYNFDLPPFGLIRAAARFTRTPVVPIIFDIGLPLTDHGAVRNRLYALLDRKTHSYCRSLDGAAVIVAKICTCYFPERHALLLDGGLGPEVLSRLPPLERTAGEMTAKETVFVLAGRLVHYNGIDLVLDAMERLDDANVRLIVAGGDANAEMVARMKKDPRIDYRGMLDLDALFKVYQSADVLLNLRLTHEIDSGFWFPSKFIEALAVGRIVLSTEMGHMKAVYGAHCRLLSEETPDALCAKMRELAAMPRSERDGIGAAARAFMLKEHTWVRQTARLLDYCKGIREHSFEGRKGLIDEI